MSLNSIITKKIFVPTWETFNPLIGFCWVIEKRNSNISELSFISLCPTFPPSMLDRENFLENLEFFHPFTVGDFYDFFATFRLLVVCQHSEHSSTLCNISTNWESGKREKARLRGKKWKSIQNLSWRIVWISNHAEKSERQNCMMEKNPLSPGST